MHAPFEPPAQSLHPTWRHHEGTQYYFDANRVGELMARYNATGEARAIDELLARCKPLVKSLIRYGRADQCLEANELANLVYVKLWRSVRLYDESRGSPFSFVALVTSSVLASAIGNAWTYSDRYAELNAEAVESVFAPNDAEAVDYVLARVRQVKTPLTEELELSAQR